MTEAPPVEAVREYTEKALAGEIVRLVALKGSKVVGWCDVHPRDREGFRHCGTLGIGLLPEYRGKGTGRRLMEETIARARQAGLLRVELEVYASNAAAIALYEKLGFEREGLKKRGRFIDGKYDDVLQMALFLR
jgi:ribosomal protein S18 acetylase RimI-like enzyme